MEDFRPLIVSLLDGLYRPEVIDDVATVGAHYLNGRRENPTYDDVPPQLHKFTDARKMSDVKVPAPQGFDSHVLRDLAILGNDGVIKGSFNHIITRIITIPMIIGGYVENWPPKAEQDIYTDPPIFQRDRDYVARANDKYFAQAGEKLSSPEVLARRFKMLGELGQDALEIEPVYPASGPENASTEAYENFGIWHLMPDNMQVDLTATSPGVILPTEADPFKYKDTVNILKKNLMRFTYFEMLKRCVSSPFAEGRVRRYFAGKEGTANNINKYPQFADAAKKILAQYLALGDDVFQIRLGDILYGMNFATLVGDLGVVYSIRDEKQKKIAHNLTVYDPDEGKLWRTAFDAQWSEAEPLNSVNIIDRLMGSR